MPLHFPTRHQQVRRTRLQFGLAFLALALAIALLISWLCIRYYLSGAGQNTDTDASSTPIADTHSTETSATLLILNEPGHQRFFLLQAVPTRQRIHVMALPANTHTDAGQTLAQHLQKSGSPLVKSTAETLLGLPIRHYITLTVEDVITYLNDLEGGITYNLPEAVRYTDENGAHVQLEAGERPLTAAQVGALLRYENWTAPANAHNTTAGLIASILNQHMTPDRGYNGLFSALATLMQSDIRIDDYNAYRSTLLYLVSNNTGNLCQVVPLTGAIDAQGRFLPDIGALRQESDLYETIE